MRELETRSFGVWGKKYTDFTSKDGYRLPEDLEEQLNKVMDQYYTDSTVKVLACTVTPLIKEFENKLMNTTWRFPVEYWVVITFERTVMYSVENEDGRFWYSYETIEEALSKSKELNASLGPNDNEWGVYEKYIDYDRAAKETK